MRRKRSARQQRSSLANLWHLGSIRVRLGAQRLRRSRTFTSHRLGGAAILDEAKRKVEMMEEICDSLRSRYEGIVNSMDTISQNLQALTEAQEKAGDLEDSRAKDAIALYSALISVAMKSGADGASAVENAGYILYAYLGGQAARNVNFDADRPITKHVQLVAGRRL